MISTAADLESGSEIDRVRRLEGSLYYHRDPAYQLSSRLSQLQPQNAAGAMSKMDVQIAQLEYEHLHYRPS